MSTLSAQLLPNSCISQNSIIPTTNCPDSHRAVLIFIGWRRRWRENYSCKRTIWESTRH